MCGRYTLIDPGSELADAFEIDDPEEILSDWDAHYNIAPSMQVPVILNETQTRSVRLMRWGLVPKWAKTPSVGTKMINARAESLHEKPAFRNAFRHRRCLLPASGFYEWQAGGRKGNKQPFYFTATNRKPLALAGLWELWVNEETLLESCTIITTAANTMMSAVHDRMPVILTSDHWDAWLDPELGKLTTDEQLDRLGPLLTPCGEDFLQKYPVSTLVNSPSVNTVDCIAIEGQDSLF